MSTIMQYIDGNSFFHRMDPSMKILWSIVVLCIAFAVTDPYFLALLLIVQLLVLRILSGISFKSFGKKSLVAFGPAIGFFIIYSFLYPSGKTILLDLSIVKVSLEGMMFGAAIALRFPVSVLTAIVFVLTTDQRKFTYSLIQVLRIPYRIGYILMIALRAAPLIEEELGNIIDAHTVRGMDLHTKGLREKFKKYRLLLIPLMVRLFSMGDQMAISMESRAFGAYDRMTFLEQMKPSRKDIAFLLIWIIAFIAVLVTGIGNLGQFGNTFNPWMNA